MTDLEELWKGKSDGQVLEAVAYLSDYSDEAGRVIQAEFDRRQLQMPTRRPVSATDVAAVTRLHRRFARLVVAQWSVLLFLVFGGDFVPNGMVSTLWPVLTLVLLGTLIAIPVTGYQLLKRLEVDTPGRTAALMYMPLFGLLSLFGLKAIEERWGKLHGIEVGVLGPREQAGVAK